MEEVEEQDVVMGWGWKRMGMTGGKRSRLYVHLSKARPMSDCMHRLHHAGFVWSTVYCMAQANRTAEDKRADELTAWQTVEGIKQLLLAHTDTASW